MKAVLIAVMLIPMLANAEGYMGGNTIDQKQQQRQSQTARGGRGGAGGMGGASDQSQTATGGDSDQSQTARGGRSDQRQRAVNEGNNNSTTYHGDDYDDMYSDYVASAIAPQLVTGTCLGSASAGFQIPGWAGLSGGSTVLDEGCDAMRASLHMLYLGQQLDSRDLKRASVVRLCDHAPNRAAMGPLCPPERIPSGDDQMVMFNTYE